ncbi:MAG: hypothetical protein ACRC35_01245 [Angustibacter sp.]
MALAAGAVPAATAGRCARSRVRLEVVSEVLGHASIAITKDVYGHLAKGDKRRAAESMSAAIRTPNLLIRRGGGGLLMAG